MPGKWHVLRILAAYLGGLILASFGFVSEGSGTFLAPEITSPEVLLLREVQTGSAEAGGLFGSRR
jgi:hypothetical protein